MLLGSNNLPLLEARERSFHTRFHNPEMLLGSHNLPLLEHVGEVFMQEMLLRSHHPRMLPRLTIHPLFGGAHRLVFDYDNICNSKNSLLAYIIYFGLLHITKTHCQHILSTLVYYISPSANIWRNFHTIIKIFCSLPQPIWYLTLKVLKLSFVRANQLYFFRSNSRNQTKNIRLTCISMMQKSKFNSKYKLTQLYMKE